MAGDPGRAGAGSGHARRRPLWSSLPGCGQHRHGRRERFMIPLAFDYEVAESVDHAIELLGQHGDEAKLLAGGHSLLPIMKLRLAAPTALIDLGRIADLNYVRDEGDHLAIGAMTRHCDVERDATLKEHCGLIAYTASLVGDPQVRHRGTIGGSISHGDAASDLPSALLALDANFVVKGSGGERTVAEGDFFEDYLQTILAHGDVLKGKIDSMPGGGASAHEESANGMPVIVSL